MSKWKRYPNYGTAQGENGYYLSQRDEALDLLEEAVGRIAGKSEFQDNWNYCVNGLLDRLRVKACPECGQTNAVETEMRENRCPECGGYVEKTTVRQRVDEIWGQQSTYPPAHRMDAILCLLADELDKR